MQPQGVAVADLKVSPNLEILGFWDLLPAPPLCPERPWMPKTRPRRLPRSPAGCGGGGNVLE